MRKFFLIILLILTSFYSSFSQTDSIVLFSYNSLNEWNQDLEQREGFFNEHFEGGYINFLNLFCRNFEANDEIKSLCSSGILLFSLEFDKDTIRVKFANEFWKEYKNELERIIREMNPLWNKLPNEKKTFNFSMTFEYHNSIETIKSDFNADLIFISYILGGHQSCDCFFYRNELLNLSFKNALNLKEYEIAVVLIKEMMRRDPFNMEYYYNFIEINNKIKNSSYK